MDQEHGNGQTDLEIINSFTSMQLCPCQALIEKDLTKQLRKTLSLQESPPTSDTFSNFSHQKSHYQKVDDHVLKDSAQVNGLIL